MSDLFRFTLRMPTALYDWLKAEAARENRSLHGQVLHLLMKVKDEK
jgi:hypothetical protein